MNVEIVTGNILDQPTEVIVNSWNRNVIPWWLLLPQGVSGAIKKAGGTAPFKEVAKQGTIPLGEARLTSAGHQRHENCERETVSKRRLSPDRFRVRESGQRLVAPGDAKRV